MVVGMMSGRLRIWLAIPCAPAAVAWGFVNGFFIATIRMPAFVVTLSA
jgi:ribose/xylose/arabinose/galactoside ABC-type transport system permease subunit